MTTLNTSPGYVDLLRDLCTSMSYYYRADNWGGYTFPKSFFSDFVKYYYFEHDDYFVTIYIAIIVTCVRYLFEMYLCKPIVDRLNIDGKSNREKVPESAWKFLMYSILWLYCCNILIFSGRYDFFAKPWAIWDDWKIGMSVPSDIRYLYLFECGFYMHSMYATIYMDAKRKDTFAMMVHHIVALLLLFLSYAARYHKIGLLVFFVHDVTDIFLEFTKLNVYLKQRNNTFYKLHDYAANFFFVAFTLVWFIFRLYLFPLKVLYSSGVVSVHAAVENRSAGLYGLFNFLLWALFILDIYWFYFILLFLYKVITGQVKELNDTREYDEDDSVESKKKKST